MTKEQEKAKLENLMKTLDISEAEAREVMAYDEAVEHGKPTEYDLTPDQKKVAKKMTNCDHKKQIGTNYKFQKRERKKNGAKADLIALIAEMLNAKVENLQVTNEERQVIFDYEGNSYEVNLIQKRKKKDE